MEEKTSLIKKLLERIARLLRRKPEPEPEDPYAYRTAPLRRPPRDRRGAAVAELSEEEDDRSFPPQMG
jgi:hypothetical protein